MRESLWRWPRVHLRAATHACGRRAVIGLLLLQVVAAISEGLALALLLPVIELIGGSQRPTIPGMGVTVTPMLAVSVLVVAVACRAAAQWAAAVRANEVRMSTTDTLRLETLGAVLDADWRYITSRRRSHLVQSLTTEVARAGVAVDVLVRMVVAVLTLVVAATVAILVAPILGSLALAIVVLLAVLARGTLGRASVLGASLSDRVAAFGAAVTDSLASVRLIRAHDAAGPWSDLVAHEAAAGREIQRRYVRSAAGLRAALSVVGVVAAVGLVFLGQRAGLSGAQLVVLAVTSSRLMTAAQSLMAMTQQFLNLAPALVRISELATEAAGHREERSPAHRVAGSVTGTPLVELHGVTVSYPDREPTLCDVDLVVQRSGLTVLSGASGAGKSTLLDTVLGLLRPESGTVLVDGQPLDDVQAWRTRIGYVPQSVVLVPGTVFDNLTWSAGRRVSEDDAWAALSEACLDEAVRALREGLHTPLQDFTALSGGEQQRLTLARALVRRPELLLLDEATSSLDPATEAQVLARLAASDRAVLLVTHRSAPLSQADSVVHLEDGRVSVVRTG